MAQKEITIEYPGGRVLPKQWLAHQSTAKEVGVVGGFASGKSYWLVMDTILNLVNFPGNEVLYGRLTLDEIRRTFFHIFNEICPPELVISHNKNEQKLVLKTSGEPSVLWYLGLDDAKNAHHKLKSMNLGYAAIDQLEEISESVYLAIKGRLRNKKGSRKLAFNCNPEGHNWLWKRFIKNKSENETNDIEIFEMNAWDENAPIPTKEEVTRKAGILNKETQDLVINDFPKYRQYTDNPYLPMDYLIDMLNWPEQAKRRYVFGKWDAFEGLIYTQFDEKAHIIPPFDTSGKEFVRVISMDYGKQNPMSIHFWDIDRNGTVYCSNEIYQSQLEIPVAKIMIRAMNRDKEVHTWIADGSIWDQRIEGQQSVGDLFKDDSDTSGWSINWSSADKGQGSVEAGIEIVRQYLQNDQYTDNKAKLYFMRDRCPHLIEEILDYRYKELAQSVNVSRAKNMPEQPRKFNDHAMDDMRYAIARIKRYDIRYNPDSTSSIRKFMRMYNRSVNRDVRGWMVK